LFTDVTKERLLDGTLGGVAMSINSGDVGDIGVRGVEVGGGLSNGVFPSITLRVGSAIGDKSGVGRGSRAGSALSDGAVVVDGTGSSAVVLLNAFDEVELLELVGNDVESASLDLVPVAFSGAVLAGECVISGRS
jgi:hypothetical protein